MDFDACFPLSPVSAAKSIIDHNDGTLTEPCALRLGWHSSFSYAHPSAYLFDMQALAPTRLTGFTQRTRALWIRTVTARWRKSLFPRR